MNKKFLSLAMLTAMFSLLVVSGVSAATVSGDNDSTVTVTVGTSGLSVGGNYSAAAFSLEGYLDSRSAVDSNAGLGTDYVQVRDYNGGSTDNTGHEVSIDAVTPTFTYAGSDTEVGANLALTTVAAPGTAEMKLSLDQGVGAGGLRSWVVRDGVTGCSGDTSTMTITEVDLADGIQEIFANTEPCQGTSKYSHGRWVVEGPSDGLAEGTYTISATLTLSDS